MNLKDIGKSLVSSVSKGSATVLDELMDGLLSNLKNVKEHFSVKNILNAALDKPFAMLANSAYSALFGDKQKHTSNGSEDGLGNISPSTQNIDDSDDDADILSEILAELSSYQDRSLDLLSNIDKNTSGNSLKDREDEIERRNQERRMMALSSNQGAVSNVGGTAFSAGSAAGGVMGALATALDSYLDYKMVTSGVDALKSRKGASSTAQRQPPASPSGSPTEKKGIFSRLKNFGSKAAIPALLTSGAGAIAAGSELVKNYGSELSKTTIPKLLTGASSAASAGVETVKNYGASLSKKAGELISPSSVNAGSKAVTVAGKALGAPLTIALTGYEAYGVASNEELDKDQKSKEYTKIAAKTAGAVSGAKAGSVLGASIGALFGGVGAAPGALVGAVVGGATGYLGGEFLGEKVGDAVFDKAPEKEQKSNKYLAPASEIEVMSISSKQDTEKLVDALVPSNKELSIPVREYLEGKGEHSYAVLEAGIKDYVESSGLNVKNYETVNALYIARERVRANQVKLESVSSKKQSSFSIENSSMNYSEIVSPEIKQPSDIESIIIGERRNTMLKSLSSELDATRVEKENLQNSALIAPVIIDQSSRNVQQVAPENQSRVRTGVPPVRNQDGTIQRLLNNSYKTLME